MEVDVRRAPLLRGRIERTWNLARSGARGAVGWATARSTEAIASEAAETLGEMRGLATKVGQIVSSLEGLVPEELRDALPAMATLQSAAATSDPEEVRGVVEADLGAPIADLFAAFDPEPFASASIGQVHRAVLPDGTEVAVKVQHPGIAEAFAHDLQNIGLIERFAGKVAARVGTRALIDEMRARFLDELDYAHEADLQDRVAAAFAGDPSIRIRAVRRDRSGPRVLTTTFVRGLRLSEARDLPVGIRSLHLEAVWRLFHGSPFRTGFLCADPHPGNLLFHADGAVTFLDFGSAQPLDPATVETLGDLHRAAITGDEGGFRDVGRALVGGSDRATEASVDLLRAALDPELRLRAHVDQGRLAAASAALLAGKRAGVGPVAKAVFPVWLPMFNRVALTVLVHAWRLDAPFDARAAVAPLLPTRPPSARP